MATILHANLVSIEYLLQVPANLSKPKKKWHSIFTTIYCSRTFSAPVNKSQTPKEKTKAIPLASSHVSLTVTRENSPFHIDQTTLIELLQDKNIETLCTNDGVDGVASALGTDIEVGISGSVEDIACRHEAFGSNTYKKPPTKSFFHFVVEAFKDLTIMILLGCAALSLGFGIKEHGPKEGRTDNLTSYKVSYNIQIDVVRRGRRHQISIFDIVVGDIVCLKIGDQVPADGLFLDGHSLQVDESSMTGESDHVETPLQARLNKLTSSIGKVGLAVALLVLVVLLVRYFTGNTTDENGNREFNRGKTKADDIINAVVGIVAAAVTIVVVAIPVGLPLAVTLTLAYSMKRMMADQAMVRKLACETMGSDTTICTDKTGTEFEFSGSPTEKAILSWAVLELNMDMEKTKRSYAILHVEAFNSQKKRSGILIGKNDDDTVHVHWKGAAEIILAMCSSYYDASGNVKDLNIERVKFEQIIQGMAASSLRCIAFAHKQIPAEEYENLKVQKKLKEDNLTLLALVGIKDPRRPGVKKAVEDCQYAGVNIKMITGDTVFTAKAIATECGILRPGEDMSSDVVVEGEVFRNYTPKERMEKVEKICVMARSSPFDKLLMVQCLKQKGHVVAVTGDGTNDAPALKEADIGLSMGIQGTEVAKESSDIVILDDNFASVATVLRWGRCVYNNIQKFIQFQLTVNVAALCINFVAAVSAGEVPLTAVQLLWVNLIMDTFGALALATERPTRESMEKPPVGRTEPLITNIMWRNLLAQALYQIAVLLTLQFSGESIFVVTKKVNDTLIFNTFVLCQVFNEFNARKLEKKNVFEGIHKNKLFMGIIAITILLQVVMVEFLKRFAHTERLNWGQWGAWIAIAAMSWPIGWVVECIPVPEKPIFSYLKWRK
ncbi:hypothetical protein DITRI_Ditri15bG0086300 [Diplodiscus trichospermus]